MLYHINWFAKFSPSTLATSKDAEAAAEAPPPIGLTSRKPEEAQSQRLELQTARSFASPIP